MDLKAGIDLGTTNSCIYVLLGDEIVVVRDKHGNATVPSAVWKHKGQLKIGRTAKAYVGKSPGPILEVKRLMGTDSTVELDGEQATPVQVSAMILRYLKGEAETYIREHYPTQAGSITDVVITHPAYFATAARTATLAAGQLAGFRRVSLLPEPIAAVLAYIHRLSNQPTVAGDRRILAYDLGGGTFDVTVLERRAADREIDVLDYGGDPWLGGANVDLTVADRLRRLLVERGYALASLDPTVADDAVRIQRLKHEAEGLKIELTNRDPVERAVPGFMEDHDGEIVDLNVTISRAEFDDWIEPLISRTMRLTHRVLAKQSFADGRRLTDEELDALGENGIVARSRANARFCDVITVGSSCWMPVVKHRLDHELGCDSRLVAPDVIVAEGAALKAASAAPQDALLQTSDPAIQVALAYPPVTDRIRRVPIKGEIKGAAVPCTVVLTDVDTGQEETRAVDDKRTFLFFKDLRPAARNELALRVQRVGTEDDLLDHTFTILQDPNHRRGEAANESLAIPILVQARHGFETLFPVNTPFPIKGELRFRTPDASGQFRVPFCEGDAYRAEMVIADAPMRPGVPFTVRAFMDNTYKVTAEVIVDDRQGMAPSIEFRLDQPRHVRRVDDIERDFARLQIRFKELVVDLQDPARRMRLRARQERIEREMQQELEALRPELGHLEDLVAELQKLVAEAGMAPQLTPPYEHLVQEIQEKHQYAPNRDEIATVDRLLEDAQRAWEAQDPDGYDPAVRACREMTKGWKPTPTPTPPRLSEDDLDAARREDLTDLEEAFNTVAEWPDSASAAREKLLADISSAIGKLRSAEGASFVKLHNSTVLPIFKRLVQGPVSNPIQKTRPELPGQY